MAESIVEKINAAINGCLDQIHGSRSKSLQIAEFLNRLRSDTRWEGWEIAEVEEAVRHTAELIAK